MSTKAPRAERIEFVDGMRGLAVLCMFVLHTAHGWLQPALNGSTGWKWITGVGGMAAPLFFLLAGAGVGLQWQAAGPGGRGDRLGSALARGLSLVVLGYALRVQMWLIDGGAISQPRKWPAAGALIAAYVLGYLACERMAGGRRPGAARVGGALLLLCGGLWGVTVVEPRKLEGLLRVDVLQGIGAALMLLHLATHRIGMPWAKAAAAGALVPIAALATHAVREALPGAVPAPLAGYLAQWPVAPGERPAGMFPLLPWVAYTGVGAVLGVYWANAQANGRLLSRVAGLSLVGVALAVTTRETSPAVYALIDRFPPIVHPVRVAYRVGICLALSGVAMVLCHRLSPLRRPLGTLGAASLVVYWVHLEFAFGAAATPIRRQLGYETWGWGLAGLTLGMWLVARLWPRLRRLRRARPRPVTAAHSSDFGA